LVFLKRKGLSYRETQSKSGDGQGIKGGDMCVHWGRGVVRF